MRIFNKIDTPYTPKRRGGIGGETPSHNLEQSFKSRRKTLAKYAYRNLKIIFENFSKSITCQSLSLLLLAINKIFDRLKSVECNIPAFNLKDL